MAARGAGQLNEKVTVQQPSASVDGLGQRVESWSDLAEVWARPEPIRGREYFAAGQMQSEAGVRFTVRYRSDITRVMRVVWRGTPHAIVADPIDVDGRRVWLELMCSSGIRDGG
jgi:SPP1 family predicted phage head-tail adaptor